MTQYLESIFIYAGWTLTVLLVILAVLWCVVLVMDALLKRAGQIGLLLKFCFQEAGKSPRAFAARLFWGEKK